MTSAGAKQTTVTMIPCFGYADPKAAIPWLGRAFGFEPYAVHLNDAGDVVHAELTFGCGMIMFNLRFMTTPENAGGRCTQSVYVIVDDVDAHHARAAAAGAEIVMAPKDEDYGGRNYAARDAEGHIWSFGSYDPWTSKPAG